jgi:hypothetical protein
MDKRVEPERPEPNKRIAQLNWEINKMNKMVDERIRSLEFTLLIQQDLVEKLLCEARGKWGMSSPEAD